MRDHAGKGISLGDRAPNFLAPTTDGELDFHRWKDRSWVVLLVHPAELSPVLVTELVALSQLQEEFERRDTRVIALSIDPVSELSRWRADIERMLGIDLQHPLIGDSAGSVAAKYGIVQAGSHDDWAARRLFIIGPDHTVRLTIDYPPHTGLSLAEMLRLLDALRLADRFGVSTPADWRPGRRALLPPTVDDETALERFGGFAAEPSRLRYVDDPS